MYKGHLCTCSQSGMFRTLDSLLTCSGFSGPLLLPLPSGMPAGTDPAACCYHLGYEELTSRTPRLVGGTSTLPTPRQRSRDLWSPGSRAGNASPSRAVTGTSSPSWSSAEIGAFGLYILNRVYLAPCPWHRVGPR